MTTVPQQIYIEDSKMKMCHVICLLFLSIFLGATTCSEASAQVDDVTVSMEMLAAEYPETPLYPDLYDGIVYDQLNPDAIGQVCIERWDSRDYPELVFEDYQEFLVSSRTEQANFNLFFPLGVRAVYRTASGSECHYTYLPATTEAEVTVNEAIEMLFEMNDFWGAVDFLVAPTTNIIMAEEDERELTGFTYIIFCNGKVYIGQCYNERLDGRFNSDHPMFDCMGDDGACIFVSPVFRDKKPCIEGKTERQCRQNVLRCREARAYCWFKDIYNPIDWLPDFEIVENGEGGIIGKEKCPLYEDYYNPTNGVFKKMCFKKKKSANRYVPVYCDPEDETIPLPGYTPPETED